MKAFLVILSITLCSCTIAPQPVHPISASAWETLHRKGYDSSGYIVDSEWLRSYKSYYAIYGAKLPIREQVGDVNEGILTTDTGFYHVSFETNRRFVHMLELERSAGP